MGTANGIKTIYDFEPGHYYLISPWQRHINDTIVSIQIIDVSDDEDRRVIKAREEIESMR
jgi:hypothetical protein